MWVYGGGPPDKPVIWYHYADSRASEVPVEFLFPAEEGPVLRKYSRRHREQAVLVM
jgi:hypothetical protein